MEELIFGVALKITDPTYFGLYRVVGVQHGRGAAAVCFARFNPEKHHSEHIETATSRKGMADYLPGSNKVHWISNELIESLWKSGQASVVEVCIDASVYGRKPVDIPDDQTPFDEMTEEEKRLHLMRDFLDADKVQSCILENGDFGALISTALTRVMGEDGQPKRKKAGIYKLLQQLCRLGFRREALAMRRDLQGAPGVSRPCDPGGRKKAGAPTTAEKIELESTGVRPPPQQPGMNSQWESIILGINKKLSPSTPIAARALQIQKIGFCQRVRTKDGCFETAPLVTGTYPNDRQIARVINRADKDIGRQIQKTSEKHFLNNERGSIGRAHDGVAGPGHRWAIDSTVGDMYLVSSINRSWIIGRPYVYVIVDIWSTAVVGFYVCLHPPRWDMVTQALFTAAAPKEVMSQLMGFDMSLGLTPSPSMCASLLCDRGEYLSKAGRVVGRNVLINLEYAAPYRPDMKGHVEVLHRISKDRLYHFAPGAIDQRRAEFEKRPSRPQDACLTLDDYASILSHVFQQYNLTANREKRMDVHMKACGVHPSPAGLWKWGHDVGIGLRRAYGESDAISHLLFRDDNASVTKRGLHFMNREYRCPEMIEQQWTTHASLFGSYKLNAHFFHGRVSTIWVPNTGSTGFLRMTLSDTSTASPELSIDEVMDAEHHHKAKSPSIVTDNKNHAISNQAAIESIVRESKRKTALAQAASESDLPSLTEARQEEMAKMEPGNAAKPAAAPPPADSDESDDYYSQLKQFLKEGVLARA